MCTWHRTSSSPSRASLSTLATGVDNQCCGACGSRLGCAGQASRPAAGVGVAAVAASADVAAVVAALVVVALAAAAGAAVVVAALVAGAVVALVAGAASVAASAAGVVVASVAGVVAASAAGEDAVGIDDCWREGMCVRVCARAMSVCGVLGFKNRSLVRQPTDQPCMSCKLRQCLHCHQGHINQARQSHAQHAQLRSADRSAAVRVSHKQGHWAASGGSSAHITSAVPSMLKSLATLSGCRSSSTLTALSTMRACAADCSGSVVVLALPPVQSSVEAKTRSATALTTHTQTLGTPCGPLARSCRLCERCTTMPQSMRLAT